MNREEKLVVRAEILITRLAANRLGFESIPYMLIGNFFVEIARGVWTALVRRV